MFCFQTPLLCLVWKTRSLSPAQWVVGHSVTHCPSSQSPGDVAWSVANRAAVVLG